MGKLGLAGRYSLSTAEASLNHTTAIEPFLHARFLHFSLTDCDTRNMPRVILPSNAVLGYEDRKDFLQGVSLGKYDEVIQSKAKWSAQSLPALNCLSLLT